MHVASAPNKSENFECDTHATWQALPKKPTLVSLTLKVKRHYFDKSS